jgi:hypothetical protein
MLTPELVKKIRHIEIRTKRLVNDSYAGDYHSIFKGRGMDDPTRLAMKSAQLIGM